MKIAPIIHTRTYSCDFNSEFMVRPDTFMDSDIKWARKNVLMATGSIDGLQGERWLIADNGKYRMAGLVGFLKNICEKCSLSDEQMKKSEEMFCDDKGRLIYAFIGIVIDKQDSGNYGSVTYEFLWNLYYENIRPVWKRTYQEAIRKPFYEFELIEPQKISAVELCKIGSQELYEANPVNDYKLFCNYLSNGNKTDFSFCSNIQDFNLAKNCDFSIMTTSQNTITRLKRDNANVTNVKTSENYNYDADRTACPTILQTPEGKKKSFLVLTVCLLILVIIILILLLLTGNSNAAGVLALNVMNCQIQREPLGAVITIF